MGESVIWAGNQMEAENLAQGEMDILHHDVLERLAWGNSFYRDLFQSNMTNIEAAARVAKKQLAAPFTGAFAADSQVGVQLIRPGHLLRSTSGTETAQNDWTFTFTDNGDYWIGYDTNNTTAVHVDKRACILVLGIAFTQGNGPCVEELLVQIGSTSYPVQVIRSAWFADNPNRIRAARIYPWLLEPKATALVQTYSLVGGTQEMVLLGLTFGLGSYLRLATYGAPQT